MIKIAKTFSFAIACIIIGGIILGGAIGYAIANPDDIESEIKSAMSKAGYYEKVEHKTYTQNDITKLIINSSSANIDIMYDDSNFTDEVTIEYSEIYEGQNLFKYDNGVLTYDRYMKNFDVRQILFYTGISWLFNDYFNAYIRVIVPSGADVLEYDIDNTSGNFVIRDIQSKNFNLQVRSGNIRIDNLQTDAFTIGNSSGNTTINDLHCESLNINMRSGDLSLYAAAVVGNTEIDSVSGSVTVSELQGSKLEVQARSGRINVYDTVVPGGVNLDSVSGNIYLKCVEGNAINILARSGNIVATEIKGNIKIDTTSGGISVTDATGDKLEITARSGNVIMSGVTHAEQSYDVVSGGVTLTLPFAANECSLDLNTRSGNCYVDGTKHSNKYQSTATSAVCAIKAVVSSGNVRITTTGGTHRH